MSSPNPQEEPFVRCFICKEDVSLDDGDTHDTDLGKVFACDVCWDKQQEKIIDEQSERETR